MIITYRFDVDGVTQNDLIRRFEIVERINVIVKGDVSVFFVLVRVVNHLLVDVHFIVRVAVAGASFAAFGFNVSDFMSLVTHGVSRLLRGCSECCKKHIVVCGVRIRLCVDRIDACRSVFAQIEIVSGK